MTLQQLEYILAVARHGHFGRAAEACNVTQPTLSAMIGKLEEEIGAKLFDRNRQPICPTAIGEKVVWQARERLKVDSMSKGEKDAYYRHLDNIVILRDNILTERAEGRAEGRAEAILATARNMKSLGLPQDIIQQATGLTLDEIENL